MMAGFQELTEEVWGLVGSSSLDQLKEAALVLAAPEAELVKAAAKGKQGMRLLIIHILGSTELEDAEDGGESLWRRVADTLRVREVDRELAVEDLKDEEREGPASSAPSPSMTAGATRPSIPGFPVWRKEFKIVGHVGEPGQKEKLSFSSLTRQMEAGSQKGFTGGEITEAVICAISPGSRLRSYLEGRPGLDLPTLQQIIRTYFREKDATSLFHELSTAAQGNKESAHEFVLRVLDLKQKILFASKEARSGVIYDEAQVDVMLHRSLATGIHSESIRGELKPYLQDPRSSDEDILEALTLATSEEVERVQKLRPSHRRADVAEASVEDPAHRKQNQEKG